MTRELPVTGRVHRPRLENPSSGRRHFAAWKLALYLLALWILGWSFTRILKHHLSYTLDGNAEPVGSWLFLIVTGALAVIWLVIGILLLFCGERWRPSARVIRGRPQVARASLCLAPGLLWTSAFLLHRAAPASDLSLADGPAVVLLSGGLVAFLHLLKQPQMEAEATPIRRFMNPAQHSQPRWLRGRAGVAARILAPVLVVTVIPLVVFSDSLFDAERVVFGQDLFALHYMVEQYVREAVHAGQWPLWNPYIFSGSPALAHPQYLVFYPPQMLLRLLPLNLSISWGVAIHVWIAGIGMLVLSRRIGLRPWIGITCALGYMLNSGLLLRIYAGHVWLMYALAWFPLVWSFVMLSLETGHPLAGVCAAIGISLILLTGHPTFPLYILLFFALYWLHVCYGLWRNRGVQREIGVVTIRFGFIVLAAFGLSAIQLVPSAVMVGQVSLGDGYSPSQANFLALSVPDLLAAIIPRFYTDPDKVLLYWEVVPYVGVLFLLLLPLAYAGSHRRSLAMFLGAVSILSVTAAFGQSLGIFSLAHALLPGFELARIPPRALCMFVPAVIVLGGLGLEAVSTRSEAGRAVIPSGQVYASLGWVVAGSALGYWLSVNSNLLEALPAPGLEPVRVAVTSLTLILFPMLCLTLLPAPRASIRKLVVLGMSAMLGCLIGALLATPARPITGNIILSALLTGASGLLISYLHRFGPTKGIVLSLLALLCLDLGAFSLPHISGQPPPRFYQDERVVLEQVETRSFARVWSTTGHPDQYMLGHLTNIDGHNSGILQGYDAFLRAMSDNPETGTPQILPRGSDVDRRALDFLGVDYIITTGRVDDSTLGFVSHRDDYFLYANGKALPRAFVVYDFQAVDTIDAAIERLIDSHFDYARDVVLMEEPELRPKHTGEGFVFIDHYTPTSGDLSMTVWTSEPGLLVMSEPRYSERRVWVDGQETKLIAANVAFSAVALRGGLHRVELRYVPTSLYLGAVITTLFMLTCVCVVLFSGTSRFRRARAAHADQQARHQQDCR